ncbi:hypothetical protein FRC02_003096, partial [Tulasnella sp. 418]
QRQLQVPVNINSESPRSRHALMERIHRTLKDLPLELLWKIFLDCCEVVILDEDTAEGKGFIDGTQATWQASSPMVLTQVLRHLLWPPGHRD